MMCISLFSYGRPVVVRCKGVGLGMGWVGSVIWWVGLGWVDENRPTDNSGSDRSHSYECHLQASELWTTAAGDRSGWSLLRSSAA